MRRSRIKADFQNSWYHCYNRIAGTSCDLPFRNIEKEQFVRFLHRVCLLYTVRVVAYQVMSNHFHLLVQAPAEEPLPEEVCRRYSAFHRGKRTLEPESPACRAWQVRCRDISWFMRHLQHLFTAWYNRTRPIRRRGSLWADRFKNTLLEGGAAVWSCWRYIENNPVRASMVKDSADYRFSSYGVWRQTGRHPFEEQISIVLLPMMNSLFGIRSIAEIRTRMAEALDSKSEGEIAPTEFSITIHRRVRHWTSGLIIGSELFLRNVMARYETARSVQCHRVARAENTGEYPICAWRKLRVADSN
jgi:REP element-mobilizing transposase RayT